MELCVYCPVYVAEDTLYIYYNTLDGNFIYTLGYLLVVYF